MIRALGFLTGIVVTGTAVWLLSDGFAAKAALDSLSAYLAESEHPGEAEPAPVEAERRILPPAAIMRRDARMPGLPAAIREASSAGAGDPVDAAAAVTVALDAPDPTPGEAPGLVDGPGSWTAASDAPDTPEPESRLAPVELRPIGVIRSCFPDKFGIPRQPGLVPEAEALLELLPPYDRVEAVRGLELIEQDRWSRFADRGRRALSVHGEAHALAMVGAIREGRPYLRAPLPGTVEVHRRAVEPSAKLGIEIHAGGRRGRCLGADRQGRHRQRAHPTGLRLRGQPDGQPHFAQANAQGPHLSERRLHQPGLPGETGPGHPPVRTRG